jgi:hypothetical protein
MDTSSIVGWSGLVLSIIGIIYSAVNHKHIRSKCCGRVYDFSIDVENTTDEEERKKKEEEEIKKKEEEENKKKAEEDEKKKKEEKTKLSYTPHNFKIQPIKFDI